MMSATTGHRAFPTRRWRTARERRCRGSVLIVVMVACLGLVSLALLFGHSMLMAYRGCDNDLAGHQADQAIEAGVRYAEYLVANATAAGEMPDPSTYQADDLAVGDATFWFIGTPGPSDSGTTPVFGLVDEASKLNLNTATQDMLLALPGMTQDLAAQIAQWRTSTSDASTSSSSTSISTGEVKFAPFESVQELAILTGTDTTTLYGADENLNHVLDSNEDDSVRLQSSTGSQGPLDSGLLEYVTVFTREPATLTDGTARINVTQTPPPPALMTLLTNQLGRDRAATIARSMATGGPVGSVLEFFVRSGMTAAEFGKIAGKLRGSRLTGLVNVNTASQTVLACIPGITADMAAQLVSARESGTQPPTGLAWVAPILGTGVKAAGPWLTGVTYQVCADVAAVGRHGRGYRRAQFIVDSSTGTPRIIYRRNLASLGWALGNDVRQALALKREYQ